METYEHDDKSEEELAKLHDRMKSMQNIFTFIADKPDFSQKNSVAWFMQNVRNIPQANATGPMKMLGDNIHRQVSAVDIGSMYLFTYDPKHKHKLPYYDKFPLVIPFSFDAKYFTGLNLHYVSPQHRLMILHELLQFSTHKTLNERAKIEMTYRLLKSLSTMPIMQPCIKKYLKGQVKSMYVKIPPKYWHITVFLPLERFAKEDVANVWKNSY